MPAKSFEGQKCPQLICKARFERREKFFPRHLQKAQIALRLNSLDRICSHGSKHRAIGLLIRDADA